MELYHVNNWDFEPGTIINPGDWGRPILEGKKYSGVSRDINYFILFREYVFEQVRKEKFPEKPSRLHCTFACPNNLSISNFRTSYRYDCDLVYKLENIGSADNVHVAPMNLTEYNGITESLYYYVPKAANEYWSFPQREQYDNSAEFSFLEVLIGNPVKIIEKIDPATLLTFPSPN